MDVVGMEELGLSTPIHHSLLDQTMNHQTKAPNQKPWSMQLFVVVAAEYRPSNPQGEDEASDLGFTPVASEDWKFTDYICSSPSVLTHHSFLPTKRREKIQCSSDPVLTVTET